MVQLGLEPYYVLALLFELLFQPGNLLHRRFLQFGDAHLQPLDLAQQLADLKIQEKLRQKTIDNRCNAEASRSNLMDENNQIKQSISAMYLSIRTGRKPENFPPREGVRRAPRRHP